MLPTSSGVCHFAVNFNGVPVHCLDIEGEDASSTAPTEDQDSWISTVLDLFGKDTPETRKNYFKLRTKAVKEHFPRLGYAVSDVIVLVDTVSLANVSYKKKIKNFTHRASDGLLECEPPCLLVVQNQTFKDKSTLQNPEAITKQFLDTHDPNGNLTRLFSKIQCVGIPNSAAGEDFWLGIETFGKTLVELINYSNSFRKIHGNTLSSNSWFYFMHQVVTEFHSENNLRIGSMITKTVSEALPVALRTAIEFYVSVNVTCVPQHCNNAISDSVRMLAVLSKEQIYFTKRIGVSESDQR
jgi:hypothetical protein